MALQNFVSKAFPAISAAWLNLVDLIKVQYDRTAAEIAAGVTPTNTGFAPGNILRYGADPLGIALSTTAIQNASKVAKDVYYPVGTYLVDDMITLTISQQRHHGEGVNSIISVKSTFNLARQGLYFWTPGAYPNGAFKNGPQFENLHITCDQTGVANAGVRANLVQYPAALYMRNAPRVKIVNCLIEQFLIGVDVQGYSAGLVMDVVYLCCYTLGVVIDGSGDTIHMDYLHCIPYDTWTTNQKAIYFDGGKTDIVTGRNDGMDLINCLFLGPGVAINSFSGTGVNYPGTFTGSGWLTGKTGNALIANTGFDTAAQIISGAVGSTITLTNCYFSNGTLGNTTQVVITAGTLLVNGGFTQSTPVPSVPFFTVNNASGQLAQLNLDAGFTFNAPAGTGTLITVTGTTLSLVSITNCNFLITNAANGPLITTTGANVQMVFSGNQFGASTRGGNIALSIDTDNTHIIQGNAFNGWNIACPPGTPIASASQTVANPGVFTTLAQTWSAGQQVYITGTAPGGYALNTIYYVIAGGLTATTAELALTFGGAGIQCTSSAACSLVPINATTFTKAIIGSNSNRGTVNFNNASLQVLNGNAGSGTVAAASTVYLGPGGYANAAVSVNTFQIPKAGNIVGFQVKANSGPGGATTFVYTVFQNGVATAMTGTLTGAPSVLNVNTNFFAVAIGDRIELQLVTLAGAVATNHAFSILYEPA